MHETFVNFDTKQSSVFSSISIWFFGILIFYGREYSLLSKNGKHQKHTLHMRHKLIP